LLLRRSFIFTLGYIRQELRDLSPCKAYGRKHKIGTIVEETTPAEKSPERKSDERDKVEEEKVTDELNNEQETEPSRTMVQALFFLHQSPMISEVIIFLNFPTKLKLMLPGYYGRSKVCLHMVSIWIGIGAG